MDDEDDDEIIPTMDLSEHYRTWRLFVAFMKWHMVGLFVLLLALLAFRAHG